MRRAVLVILIMVVAMTMGIISFTKLAPQFGQKPNGAELERIQGSPNFVDGQFINTIETKLGSFSDVMGTLPKFIFGKNLKPNDTLPVNYQNINTLNSDSLSYITWFGHSAFLVEIDGLRILIDPMLTERPSPVPFGSRRFPNQKPIPLESLTEIDLVIISHDHYDHLDYQSILALKHQVKHFYTPLGVGSHLRKWGVADTKITELDWWQSIEVHTIKLTACPARHFSGRGFGDGNATQWASWVIKGATHNLYFSGDSGYGPHFEEIGNRHGPFDLAMLECGQYNQAWKDIHMMPEESVQAGIEVQADHLMAVHWGAFALSIHQWREPIERFKREALKKNVSLIHPLIGERFRLGHDFPREEWWQTLK